MNKREAMGTRKKPAKMLCKTLTEIIVSKRFQFMLKPVFGEDIWQLMLITPEKITARSQSLSLPQAVIISAYIRLLNIIKRFTHRNLTLSWQRVE